MSIRHVICAECPVLQGAFCHASIHNNSTIYISGTIGTFNKPNGDGYALIEGGIGAQTSQTLTNMETIVKECGSSMANLVKLQVYLKDNNPERFAQMNTAYVAFFKKRNIPVCARITVGCGNLALGSDVEIDGIAIMPPHSKL